jgi:hypothetical protein
LRQSGHDASRTRDEHFKRELTNRNTAASCDRTARAAGAFLPVMVRFDDMPEAGEVRPRLFGYAARGVPYGPRRPTSSTLAPSTQPASHPAHPGPASRLSPPAMPMHLSTSCNPLRSPRSPHYPYRAEVATALPPSQLPPPASARSRVEGRPDVPSAHGTPSELAAPDASVETSFSYGQNTRSCSKCGPAMMNSRPTDFG